MTAKGDGFAVFVAPVRIATVAGFKLAKREVTRIGFDAAQLWHINRSEDRKRPHDVGSTDLRASTQLRRLLLWPQRLGRNMLRHDLWTIGNANPHALGAADG